MAGKEIYLIYDKYAEGMYEYFLHKSGEDKAAAEKLSIQLWTAFLRRKAELCDTNGKINEKIAGGWLWMFAKELTESME